MKPQFRIVKCKKCGTEYKMPNIGDFKVDMDSCPVCKEIEDCLKKLLEGED